MSYRGARVRCEAVLANEDALAPGEYPVRLLVVGPQNQRVFEKTVNVTIAKDAPFAVPIFSEDVVVNGPSGRYRFLASFERGGAATGGETSFYVADPPRCHRSEPKSCWLALTRSWPNGWPSADARRGLLRASRPRRGSRCWYPQRLPPVSRNVWRTRQPHRPRQLRCVPVAQRVPAKGDNPTGWLPLKNKGSLTKLMGWLYHKDEWAKAHPVFDGLPSGGIMDYAFYREIIPELVFTGQGPPAEAIAGANNASFDYSSGLMLAEYRFGAGRFFLNTLPIRERLPINPVAERLLRNLLLQAAVDIGQPPGDLPADFEQHLKALGYPLAGGVGESGTQAPSACR